MARATDQFDVSNRLRALHRLIQVLLCVLFFGGLNYAAMRHFVRYDATQQHLFSLSPETEAYIASLEEPIRFIVTIPRASAQAEEQLLYRYVQRLLDQYRYQAKKAGIADQIEVEYVNTYEDIARAAELAQNYGIDQPNIILVVGSNRTRLILPTDLMEFEERKPVAFKGEQALTSALIDVSASRTPRIYFTVGHVEMRLDDVSPQRGLSQLASQLRTRNFEVGALDLSQSSAVPEDADAVVIADPRGPFLPSEQEKLRRYLSDRAGRLLLFLSPGQKHGLEALLEDWGIRADDMLVLENDPNYVEGAGSYLIRQLVPHPVTNPLIKNQTFLVTGLMRPVRPDIGASIDDRLRVSALLGSSRSSWGERAYTQSGSTPVYDAASDLPGPVTVGTVAERRSASQLGIDLPGGRVVAIGSGDLFANRRLTSSLGNSLFFSSTMNWMLDRDQTLALPPRPIENYQVAISQGELRQLGLLYLAIPGTLAVFGLILLWIRKL